MKIKAFLIVGETQIVHDTSVISTPILIENRAEFCIGKYSVQQLRCSRRMISEYHRVIIHCELLFCVFDASNRDNH